MTKKQKLQIFGISFILLITFLIVKNTINEKVVESESIKKKSTLIECSPLTLKNTIPTIGFSGRINSSQKINIVSEVNGISRITSSRFEVGETFKKGEILLSVKDDDINLELKSIKSQFLALLVQVLPDIKMDFPQLGVKMQKYINGFTLNGKIENLPKTTSSKAKTFLSSRQVFANYFTIKALENRLDKFKIRAPFDGFLTKALIDLGSNVIVGQPLGEFINPNEYEISTSISIREAGLIQLNNKVIISSEDLTSEIIGSVNRIGNHINELTQSIDVFISIEKGNVIDGMYVSGKIVCDPVLNTHTIERARLLENNEVYLLEDNILKSKSVDVIIFQNDSVVIKGLNEQDCIVNQYRHYFHDGMSIN